MPKQCEVCDQTIGDNDKVCPNPECGVDLETLEEEIKVIERANKVAKKRAEKNTSPAPAPAAAPSAAIEHRKTSVFRSLSMKGKK